MFPSYSPNQRIMPSAMPPNMPPTMPPTMQAGMLATMPVPMAQSMPMTATAQLQAHSPRPSACTLIVEQQPKEALAVTPGKEKMRKPIDPPPIVELRVDEHDDPRRQFLQSPYWFLSAALFKPDKDEPADVKSDRGLVGTLVSSLHRLKSKDNKDCGYFVFGDISVVTQGSFRLGFSLFNFQPDTNEIQCMGTTISSVFHVVAGKDFKGMEESTYTSRAFADQGVRLRLRKEARTGGKRSFDTHEVEENPSPKRQRQDVQISPYPSSAAWLPTATYTPTTPYESGTVQSSSTSQPSGTLYDTAGYHYGSATLIPRTPHSHHSQHQHHSHHSQQPQQPQQPSSTPHYSSMTALSPGMAYPPPPTYSTTPTHSATANYESTPSGSFQYSQSAAYYPWNSYSIQ